MTAKTRVSMVLERAAAPKVDLYLPSEVRQGLSLENGYPTLMLEQMRNVEVTIVRWSLVGG